tara:strand:- start:17747 stop:17971 length:225 start_codon:yes stop_codon:yes gene_type:complete
MGFINWLYESSTTDAAGALDSIIGFLTKANRDTNGDQMLTMAKGIKDHYGKKKSFSPGQASWIYNTSKALFKKG